MAGSAENTNAARLRYYAPRRVMCRVYSRERAYQEPVVVCVKRPLLPPVRGKMNSIYNHVA